MKKVETEADAEKTIDLRDKLDTRKYLRNALDDRADNILTTKKCYVLCKVVKNEADEEEPQDIVIDGACIRTPDEDIKWEVEQEELKAAAAKGGKGKPPPKKK